MYLNFWGGVLLLPSLLGATVLGVFPSPPLREFRSPTLLRSFAPPRSGEFCSRPLGELLSPPLGEFRSPERASFSDEEKEAKESPGTLRSRTLRLLRPRGAGLTHHPSKKSGVPLKCRCKGDAAAVARALKPTRVKAEISLDLHIQDGLPWKNRAVDPASPPTSAEYIGSPTIVGKFSVLGHLRAR